MTLDKARALHLEHAGHTHFFCSQHCCDVFAAGGSGDVPKASSTGEVRAAGLEPATSAL